MDNEMLVLITAASPVIELRGAIPLGLALKMPLSKVFILSIIGNILPVPFILLGASWVVTRLKNIPAIEVKLSQWSSQKTAKLSGKIRRWGWIGLLLFVAIPLPGTGAWTGSMAAALLGLNFWTSLLAVIAGILVAGIIVSGAGLTVLLAI